MLPNYAKDHLCPINLRVLMSFSNYRFYIVCIDFYVSQNSFYLWKLCRGKPRFYYFAGCFLYLCKLMLLHLKSLWHYSQDTTKTISAIIDGTTTKTSFIAQYVDEREIFHIFLRKTLTNGCFTLEKKRVLKCRQNYIVVNFIIRTFLTLT